MTKAQLATAIAHQTGQDQADILQTIDALTESIKSTVAENESIFIRGFGTFIPKHRPTRKARDIKRNTTIVIEAHTFPFFKTSKEFANQVKQTVAL